MIVRTYTADLTGPPIESGDATVRPVRRLRAWSVTLGSPGSPVTFQRASAVPVGVDVTRAGACSERMSIRNPEAPILAALKAASTATSLAARRQVR